MSTIVVYLTIDKVEKALDEFRHKTFGGWPSGIIMSSDEHKSLIEEVKAQMDGWPFNPVTSISKYKSISVYPVEKPNAPDNIIIF